MTFVALEQSAMVHEGRGDGPAQIFTDLQGEAVPEGIVSVGFRPKAQRVRCVREVRNSGGSMSDGPCNLLL